MKRVYLDHNATSPLADEVRARWLEVADELAGNPSSLHTGGRRARDLIDQAREQVAAALGVPEEAVVFTSGGTESNNTALAGVLAARGPASRVVTSGCEHSSVLDAARACAARGHGLDVVSSDELGRPDPDELRAAVARPETALVSLQAANNEVGTVLDLQDVAEVCDATASRGVRRVRLHTDAVQALGRLPIDLDAWGVDLASFSAHKVGGPVGTGVLVRRKAAPLVPLLVGGGQEGSLRAGTEDVCGIVAAALAVERAVERQAAFHERARTLCHAMWHELCMSVPDVRLVGPPVGSRERLPNTLSFLVPGEEGKVLVTRLDLEGLSVGAGSACASGSLEPSHVLLAMGYDAEDARAALRVSLGHETTRDECRAACDVFRKVFSSTRAS